MLQVKKIMGIILSQYNQIRINPAERSNVITLLNHKFIAGVEVPEKPISLGGGEKLEILKKQAQTPSSARNRKPESIHLKTPDNPLEL